MCVLVIDSRPRQGRALLVPPLPVSDGYRLYRPDSQHGEGQYIEDCSLAQVENAMKIDIEIERDSYNNNQQRSYYYLIAIWN